MFRKFSVTYILEKTRSYIFGAVLFSVPFVAVSAIYGKLRYGLYAACVPFSIAAILIVLRLYDIIRFRSAVTAQERSANAKLECDKFEHICGGVYISDSWLVCAGRFALHKSSVRTVSVSKKRSLTQGLSQLIEISSASGKTYSVSVLSIEDAEKIKAFVK